jgi:PIN domain nuclease of toxin-antitoxin system
MCKNTCWSQRTKEMPMTFAEIERVIGAKLPPNSPQDPAWWSNNPSNNVMTKVRLAAGFRTEQVDTKARRIVLRRVERDPAQTRPPPYAKKGGRHPSFGALKGLVRVSQGVDLTEPADPDWGRSINEAMTLLLDTHAAIWIAEDRPLASGAVDAVDAAYRANGPIFVSAITACEIGLLVAGNRMGLSTRPERWFQQLLCNSGGVRLAELTPDILIASSLLPGEPPRDPADRIILATALDLGATFITRDRLLLRYGEDGQVSTIAC